MKKKDLYVETPDGTLIFFGNTFDSTSGGRLGEDTNQGSFGMHVENVFFPSRAPDGTYRFYAIPFNTRGQPDQWTLTVYVDGMEVATYLGTGMSATFEYER